jgi:hypothetical protein
MLLCSIHGRVKSGLYRLRLSSDFRQPEIENFCCSLAGYEDVCWFDVPVYDPLRVCCIQCISDLSPEIEDNCDVQRPTENLLP